MTDSVFTGRLFGPGIAGAGVAAGAAWELTGGLRILPLDPGLGILNAEQPSVTSGGFNAGGLRIAWQDGDASWAFIVDAGDEQARCKATAPPQISEQFNGITRKRNRLERRFKMGGALLSFIILLPLLLIVLFLLNRDRIASWVVQRIPVAHEARLGDMVLAQSRLQMKILDSGPDVDAIRNIGKRLTTGSAHTYRWFVAERSDLNAFAAPGGVVVVFRGLLNSVASSEELAGVLAHEVAHAELRHSLVGMVKGLGLRAAVSMTFGDLSDSVFTDGATRLTELRFSRDAEREADAEGLRLLMAARISPEGMLRFYERLASEKRGSPPAILSTHPASGERLDWLRNEVTKFSGSWQPLQVYPGKGTN
ncbi:MAG: M48 family metallopeptidase [Trichlorobacter sp.]|uniref:M48 family metallopeptidase n=1 Tax=Trichlorobacter sp. TaxID=2911007 RepID=UPI002564B246|nr:M48 family metallopeptidase [Trichlorobacter sp.]MDK9718705.1 M48 family metallopeptidase [Trichlorobacter sp.]